MNETGRQFIRIPFALDVAVRGPKGDFIGKTQQISTSGIIVLLDHGYDLGTDLWLKMVLPMMRASIIAKGKINFVEDTKDGRSVLFCTFIEISEEDRESIRAFCTVQAIKDLPKSRPWPKPQMRAQFVQRPSGPTSGWIAQELRDKADAQAEEDRTDTEEDLTPPPQLAASQGPAPSPMPGSKVPRSPSSRPDALTPPEDGRTSSPPPVSTTSFYCYTVSFESPEIYLDEYTHNISRGGVFISTGRPPRPHALVALRIMLPYGRGSFYCEAKVIWIRTEGEQKGMGVQFVDMDDATSTALALYAEEVTRNTGDLTMSNWAPRARQ